jgi:hypothetical protein
MIQIDPKTRNWLTLVLLGIGIGLLIWQGLIPSATWEPWVNTVGGALIYHIARFSGGAQ